MTTTTILFIIAVFLSVMFGFVCFGKLIRGETVHTLPILLMSAGFTAVITHVIGVW